MITNNRFGWGSVTIQENRRQIRVWHPIRTKFEARRQVEQYLANLSPPQQIKHQYFVLTVGPRPKNNNNQSVTDSDEVIMPGKVVGLKNMRVGILHNIIRSTGPQGPQLWVTLRMYNHHHQQTNELTDGSTTQFVFVAHRMHVVRAEMVEGLVRVARTAEIYNHCICKPNQKKIFCPFIELSPGNLIPMTWKHSPERQEEIFYKNVAYLQKSQKHSWERMMNENSNDIRMKKQEISQKNAQIRQMEQKLAQMEQKLVLKQQIIERKKRKIRDLREERRILSHQRKVTEVEHAKEIALCQEICEFKENAVKLPNVRRASCRSNNKLVLHLDNKQPSVTIF